MSSSVQSRVNDDKLIIISNNALETKWSIFGGRFRNIHMFPPIVSFVYRFLINYNDNDDDVIMVMIMIMMVLRLPLSSSSVAAAALKYTLTNQLISRKN